MEGMQFFILFVTLVGFLWAARKDSREFAKETKEFHGRLCALEERYIQMMERFMEQRK